MPASNLPITSRTMVSDALDRVPEATPLFRQHEFNPRVEREPMTGTTPLAGALEVVEVANTPIGELVARYAGVEAVLEDFGFDTCCTVEFTPLEIAEKAAIDAEPLVAALQAAIA